MSRYLRIIDRTGTTGPVIGRHLYCLGIAVMIWGALFRTVYDQTGGFRRGVVAHRGTWLVLVTAFLLPVVLDPRVGWYLIGMRPGQMPSHVATAFGLWIFAVWVAWWRVDNRLLTYLGVISYSLYLFHAVVMLTITHTAHRPPRAPRVEPAQLAVLRGGRRPHARGLGGGLPLGGTPRHQPGPALDRVGPDARRAAGQLAESPPGRALGKVGRGEALELVAHDLRAQGVAFLGAELLLAVLLEVRGLRLHEKLVRRQPVVRREEPEVHAQAGSTTGS